MAIYDKENLSKNVMIDLSDVLPIYPTRLEVCIINFSYKIMDALIEDGVIELLPGDQHIHSVAKIYHMYRVKGTDIGVINTTVGAPITSGLIEEVGYCYGCKKFVMFGSCGGLDPKLTAGKLIVPTHAFRDEGTSYHYYDGGDYIPIKNYRVVEAVLKSLNIDHVLGKTWTTDSFYRETKERFSKLKAEGCIAVEMEVSACQAVSDFRGHDFYCFLYRADALDTSGWDKSILSDITLDLRLTHFYIALALAKSLIA